MSCDFFLKHIFWDNLSMEETEEWHFFFPMVYLLIFTTLIAWGMSWTFNLLSPALMLWIMDSPAWHITRLQFKVDVTNTIAPSGAKAWLSFWDKPIRLHEFITDFIIAIALVSVSVMHFILFFFGSKLADIFAQNPQIFRSQMKSDFFSYKQDVNSPLETREILCEFSISL